MEELQSIGAGTDGLAAELVRDRQFASSFRERACALFVWETLAERPRIGTTAQEDSTTFGRLPLELLREVLASVALPLGALVGPRRALFEALVVRDPALLLGFQQHIGPEPLTPLQAEMLCVADATAEPSRNLFVRAPTGSGKSVALILMALGQVEINSCGPPQVLVLAPTREMALSFESLLSVVGASVGARSVCCVGGTPMSGTRDSLVQKKPHVIVGTPGRLAAAIHCGWLARTAIRLLVVEEADRMLDMGFGSELLDIAGGLQVDLQVCLASAVEPTLALADSGGSPCLLQFARRFGPFFRVVQPDSRMLAVGSQFHFFAVTQADLGRRKESLRVILDSFDWKPQAVIFCPTARVADELSECLRGGQFSVAALHGRMRQQERVERIDSFRKARVNVLVSTQISLRGVSDLSADLVLNFSAEHHDNDTYMFLAACGNSNGGAVLSFVSDDEIESLEYLQTSLQMSFFDIAGSDAWIKFTTVKRR